MNTNPGFRFSWRSALVAIYLVIALLGLATIINPGPVEAASCQRHLTKRVYGNLNVTQLFPMAGFAVSIDYETNSDGCRVANRWSDCELDWALGFDVDITSCSVVRNASATVITYGMNYRACLISDMLPVCYSGYTRRTVGTEGQKIRSWGSFF